MVCNIVAAMKKDAKGREITSQIRKRAGELKWKDPVAAVVTAADDAEADIVEGAVGPDAIGRAAGQTRRPGRNDSRSRDQRRMPPRDRLDVAHGWTTTNAVVHGGVSSATIAA